MKQKPVSSDEGRAMAEKINAYGYLECSAKTKEGVREVFETATRAALQVKRRNRKRCILIWNKTTKVTPVDTKGNNNKHRFRTHFLSSRFLYQIVQGCHLLWHHYYHWEKEISVRVLLFSFAWIFTVFLTRISSLPLFLRSLEPEKFLIQDDDDEVPLSCQWSSYILPAPSSGVNTSFFLRFNKHCLCNLMITLEVRHVIYSLIHLFHSQRRWCLGCYIRFPLISKVSAMSLWNRSLKGLLVDGRI